MEMPQALQVLEATAEVLERELLDLAPRRWLRATPARGWTIATQVGHLAWLDEMALRALKRDPAFAEFVARVASSAVNGFVDRGAREVATLPVPELLARWRTGRRAVAAALLAADPAVRVPWLGPSMLPRTLVAARTVEVWAHSLDVFDALALPMPEVVGAAVVAKVGVRTREASFRARRIPVPTARVRVELVDSRGRRLAFGAEGAPERVVGRVGDFAAVVVQRRNVADVGLRVEGAGAARWMRIAQAFGGVPTNGPAPGVRPAWHR